MDFSGNSSRNFTRSWHPEPTTRGSFTILSSCIITLTLCVWKAVHLNLPEHETCLPKRKKTDLRYWMTRWVTLQKWRKVGWLMLGILAPEMVAFTAWSQRREAQKLKDVMVQKLLGTPPPPGDDVERGQVDHPQPPMVADLNTEHPNQAQPPTGDEIEIEHSNQAQPPTDDETGMKHSIHEARAYFKHNPWTITHGFYAMMGGYAIDTSDLSAEQKFLPGSRDRLTLTPRGLNFLADYRPDLIPHVSLAEIKDKSKADTFAKSIITVQASFFVIQCLYRLIQRLPISLLELNTFAHTLCALLNYVFWWEKPLEVAEPSLISIGELPELWAALCFHSHFRERAAQDFDFLEIVTSENQVTVQRENTDVGIDLHHGETVGNLRYTGPNRFGRRYEMEEYPIYTPRDRLRWSLAGSCFNGSLWELASKFHTRDTTVHLPQNALFDRAANWPPGFVDGLAQKDLRDKAVIKLLMAFTLAGLSYGALHLLAWDFPFASHAEHLLWQISGLTVATSGPLFVFWKLTHFLYEISSHRLNYTQRKYAVIIILGILGVYLSLYIFARTYLIVESFISFVYLPDAAFQQPQWTYYFPHIG